MLKNAILSTFFLLFTAHIYAQDFGLVPYRLKTKWGFADSTGTVKIKPVYDNVLPFNYGYSAYQRDNKWGLIDISGKELSEAIYDSVDSYFQGFYVKDESAIKIKPVYDNIYPFKNGYALIVKKGKQGYINEKGKEFFRK